MSPDAGGSGSSGSGGAASGSSSGAPSSGSASGASGSGGSSGSAGSGASSGTGGTGSTSGSGGSGSGSGSNPNCPYATDTVTFEMSVATTLNAQYCDGTGCGGGFVTVRGPDGRAIAAKRPPCTTDCSSCTPIACPLVCLAPTVLTTTPVTSTLGSVVWPAASCGANVACAQSACTPAGHYVATMCAYLNTSSSPVSCIGSQTPTCKDVPFDWPPPGGSTTLKWVLGETDAGVPMSDAGGTGSCTSTADCPLTSECGFPVTPACSSVGTCFPTPGVRCNAFSPGCACDGTEVNVVCTGLPSGYASKPLRHAGACVDGG